jgi:ribosomal protein S18 acetylase RimI-like enzyme
MQTQPPKTVWMIRENLEDIPSCPLPEPFSVRWFEQGDEAAWLNIQNQCDPRAPFPLSLFERVYGNNPAALAQRMCFVLDREKKPIGTATAWFDEHFRGELWGRIDWVAVLPEFQGRGLGNSLLSLTCERLRSLGHQRAYLKTYTDRVVAIHLYKKFGFAPHVC